MQDITEVPYEAELAPILLNIEAGADTAKMKLLESKHLHRHAPFQKIEILPWNFILPICARSVSHTTLTIDDGHTYTVPGTKAALRVDTEGEACLFE